MKFHEQSDEWSCVLQSLAMAVDLPPEELVKKSNRIKDFVVINSKMVEHGVGVVGLNVEYIIGDIYDLGYVVDRITLLDCKSINEVKTLINGVGVLIRETNNENLKHCMAWDGKLIHDPLVGIYPLSTCWNKLETFYRLRKRKDDAISKKPSKKK